MSACGCGCQHKNKEKATPASAAENKSYICYKCNTFKSAPAEAPAPECCGKKMQEMD
ncbi:MAG: hypothetical protein P8168_04110 [Deltaproteobacteria bacterium]|jgi:hypothetical protein